MPPCSSGDTTAWSGTQKHADEWHAEARVQGLDGLVSAETVGQSLSGRDCLAGTFWAVAIWQPGNDCQAVAIWRRLPGNDCLAWAVWQGQSGKAGKVW
mmetsp:Transcript_15947/g.27474  ORF Transcript_15947/g.27474 Transcript_15947/m.27474 type:complete len:98 (+) Transcript_15947:212-505(+)